MKVHAIAKILLAACWAAMVYLILKAKYTQYAATAIKENTGVHLLMRRFHAGRWSTSSLLCTFSTRQTGSTESSRYFADLPLRVVT